MIKYDQNDFTQKKGPARVHLEGQLQFADSTTREPPAHVGKGKFNKRLKSCRQKTVYRERPVTPQFSRDVLFECCHCLGLGGVARLRTGQPGHTPSPSEWPGVEGLQVGVNVFLVNHLVTCSCSLNLVILTHAL